MVDNLSLNLQQGRIFGLLGPNGAGKSTAIRMILQIIRADKGSIEFIGRDLEEEDREYFGYLPEERGLYPRMNCAEILTYFANLKGVRGGAELEKNIDYWLERFGLTDYKHKKVEELSKGMGQKLQFIITLLHEPDIFILDEPFSGLDPLTQNLILEILIQLKEEGKTILFSTHIMDHAEKICDEICIIHKGKTLIGGKLSEIKQGRGNTLLIESDDHFPDLKQYPLVESVVAYPRGREIVLSSQSDGQELLRELVTKMRIQRFEFKAPSLHAIYSELLGKQK